VDYPDGDLTIDRDGLAKLDEWRQHCDPEDAGRVADLLRDICKRQWHGKWWARNNSRKPGIKTFRARPGLYVDVNLWADVDQFTIDEFTDRPPPGGDED
jgi:hypothetical protein